VSPKLTLKDFRYFLAVAEEENVHRAARKLLVAQPALSLRIRKIEAALGVDLFDRRNQRIRLTKVGEAFIEPARDILRRAEAAEQLVNSFSRGEAGKITIGIAESAIRCVEVKAAILAFRERYPKVDVGVVPIPKAPLLEGLENGEVDLAFIPHTTSHPIPLPHIDMATIEFLMAVPVAHRLAARDSVCINDLKEEEVLWIQLEAAPGATGALVERCRTAGVEVQLKPVLMSENGRLHLVAAGLGISVVSNTVANNIPELVVLKPFSDLDLALAVKAVWRDRDQNPALRNFIACIEAQTGRAGMVDAD